MQNDRKGKSKQAHDTRDYAVVSSWNAGPALSPVASAAVLAAVSEGEATAGAGKAFDDCEAFDAGDEAESETFAAFFSSSLAVAFALAFASAALSGFGSASGSNVHVSVPPATKQQQQFLSQAATDREL